MSRKLRWVLAALALAALAVAVGCSRSTKTGGGDPNVVEAVVPCGQIGPFSDIVKLWEKQYPKVKLKWRMGNMVTITEEVLSGSNKPDAFLSMGDLEVDRLQQAGLLVDGTRTAYAPNALVFTVPADNPAGVATLQDFAKPAVKAIAVPDPEKNSVGKHGTEALEAAGIWKQIEGKVISTTYAADSKEMGEKGQIDASLDYYPCVSEVHVPGQPPVEPKGIRVTMVPANLYKPFSCEAAVVKGSGNPEGGKKLIALLKTPEAQQLFTRWSFRRDMAPAK